MSGPTALPLACTVRGCAQPLERRGAAYVCPRGHAYDLARSGYLNLLQPQDRRSRSPGDDRAAVRARAELLDAGIGGAIVQAFVDLAAVHLPRPDPLVVELGAGAGDALAALARARAIRGIGIDLSTAAAELAARRHPALAWVVGNADRRLPLLDHAVDAVLSLHARRNPDECARVLARDGVLVMAIPAADDLIELRESVQGARVERDRGEALLREHDRQFRLIAQSTASARQALDREALLNLLRGTYRGLRRSAAERVNRLETLEVTFASEMFVFAPK